MSIRIQLSRATVKALQRRLREAYQRDDVRLVRRIQALLAHLVTGTPVAALSEQWGGRMVGKDLPPPTPQVHPCAERARFVGRCFRPVLEWGRRANSSGGRECPLGSGRISSGICIVSDVPGRRSQHCPESNW